MRIFRSIKEVESQTIETRRDFVWQASVYKVGKPKNKDDLIDTCAYGLDIRNEYWHLLKRLDELYAINTEHAVVGNNVCF